MRVLPSDALRNRLLARLEPADYERFAPHLQVVPLLYNQPIYELGGIIEYAYFPTHGVISAVVTMENGASIETATIGNEGVTGIPALIEPERSPSRLYVQIAGGAARIPLDLFRRERGAKARFGKCCNSTKAPSWCSSCNHWPATDYTRFTSAAVVGC